MNKSPFGLTTLMESLRLNDQEVMESNLLFEAVAGEESIDDNIKEEFIGDGSVEDDMNATNVDTEDPKLVELLDMIPEAEGEDEMIEELDAMLESYVADLNGRGDL